MRTESIAYRLRVFAGATGVCTAAVSVLVLYGWLADIALLKSLLPHWIPMSPATALCFFLGGVALATVAFVGRRTSGNLMWLRRGAELFAVIVGVIGSLRFGELLSFWEVHLDFLGLDVSHVAPGQPVPAAMAPATAVGFILLGATLFLLARRHYSFAVEVLPFLLASVGWLGLGSYLYGGQPLLPIAGMAAHTALCFLVLSVGMLCARSDSGLLSLVVSETVGGTLARRLLPPVLLIPVVFDLLRSMGARLGWFSAEAGQALFGLLTAMLFGTLVWTISGRLRKAELERRRVDEDRAQLAQIVASSDDAIIVATLDGTITYWNGGAEQLFGFASEEAMGRPILMLFPAAHASEEKELIESITRGERTEQFETTRLHKNGTPIPVWLKVTPLMDRNGKVTGAFTISRDLSKVKQARNEREKLVAQFEQSQKMESIGRLAGGVAHDFNNLLTVINGYTEMAMGHVDPENSIYRDLNEVLGAGKRAAGLTRQLLAFSRDQVMRPVVMNVNHAVAELERMLGRLLGEDISITLNLAPDLGNILADPGQVSQVLMNLAVNARDAMPVGGHLTIETINIYLDETYAEQHFTVQPGPYVQIAVTDSGTGMDEETMAKIFEPFFTTKERGRGTGLGLATVYGIVKQSGGSIWVYSEVGTGTVFKIYLPWTDKAATPNTLTQVVFPTSGDETIVVIEDDDKLRALTSRILLKAGYTVHAFGCGDDAVGFLERFDGRLDLLLTDVVMPGLGGSRLAEKIHSLRPELKIVYMSGYTDDTVIRHGILASALHFISKPFSAKDLLLKMREVIGVTDLGTELPELLRYSKTTAVRAVSKSV